MGKQLYKFIEEYVEGYELRGDEGDYYPNDQERVIAKDIIFGLIEEEEFINHFKK